MQSHHNTLSLARDLPVNEPNQCAHADVLVGGLRTVLSCCGKDDAAAMIASLIIDQCVVRQSGEIQRLRHQRLPNPTPDGRYGQT